MNKKLKLLLSFTSLIVIISIMATSVFAATRATLGITATVSFRATGVVGTLSAEMFGVTGPTNLTNQVFNIQDTIDTWEPGTNLMITDANNDGIFDNVTFLLTITNTSTDVNMPVKIDSLTVGDNLQIGQPAITNHNAVISAVQKKTTLAGTYSTVTASSGVYNCGTINYGNNKLFILITISVIDHHKSITSASNISFNLKLGTFT